MEKIGRTQRSRGFVRWSLLVFVLLGLLVIGGLSHFDMRTLNDARQSDMVQRFTERMLGVRGGLKSSRLQEDPSIAAAVIANETDQSFVERRLLVPPSSKLQRLAYQALFAQLEESAFALQAEEPLSFYGDARGGFYAHIERDGIFVLSVNKNAFGDGSQKMRSLTINDGVIAQSSLLNNGKGIVYTKVVEKRLENIVYRWDFTEQEAKPEILLRVADGEIDSLSSDTDGDVIVVGVEKREIVGDGRDEREALITRYRFYDRASGQQRSVIPRAEHYEAAELRNPSRRRAFLRGFSDDGARVAFRLVETSDNVEKNAIGVWSVATGELLSLAQTGTRRPLTATFLPADQGVLVGFSDGGVSYFSPDLRIEQALPRPEGVAQTSQALISAVAVLYGGLVIVAADENGEVFSWRRNETVTLPLAPPSEPAPVENAITGLAEPEEVAPRPDATRPAYAFAEQFDFDENDRTRRVFIEALSGVLRVSNSVTTRAIEIDRSGSFQGATSPPRLVRDGDTRILSRLVRDANGDIKLVTAQAAKQLPDSADAVSDNSDDVEESGAYDVAIFRVYATRPRQDIRMITPSPGRNFLVDIAVNDQKAIVAELGIEGGAARTRIFAYKRDRKTTEEFRRKVFELERLGALSMSANADLTRVYVGAKATGRAPEQTVIALDWDDARAAYKPAWSTRINFDPLEIAISPNNRFVGVGGAGGVQFLDTQTGVAESFKSLVAGGDPQTEFNLAPRQKTKLLKPHISYSAAGDVAAFNYGIANGAIVSLDGSRCVMPLQGAAFDEKGKAVVENSAPVVPVINTDEEDAPSYTTLITPLSDEKLDDNSALRMQQIVGVALDPNAPRALVAHHKSAVDQRGNLLDKSGRLDLVKYNVEDCTLVRTIRQNLSIRNQSIAATRAGKARPARVKYSEDGKLVFAADGKGAIAAFSPSGKVKWRRPPAYFAPHQDEREALFRPSNSIKTGGVDISMRSDGLAAFLTGRSDTALINADTGEHLFTIPNFEDYQFSTTLSAFEIQKSHLVVAGVGRGLIWWSPPGSDDILQELKRQQAGISECLGSIARSYTPGYFEQHGGALKGLVRAGDSAMRWIGKMTGLWENEYVDPCPSASMRATMAAQEGDDE